MPKVSVITPAYNITDDQYYLSAESLQKQTCKDFEWIIVDDGSKDNGIVYFPDIKLEHNYGPSVARNIGFQISSGDIITYLDMGDILYENRINNIINLFSIYKIQMLFSAYDMQQGDREPFIFDHFNWIGKHPKYPTAFEYIELLQKQNITVPLGVAHTRWPFVINGGFQKGIVCGEDGILWRRMLDDIPRDEVLFSDDRAGRYFILGDSQSRTQRRFEMGGFAFDGNKKDNGQYLDKDWYATFDSKGLYDEA
jgi:glycosyltransferase involved in cell wall biosynthesis